MHTKFWGLIFLLEGAIILALGAFMLVRAFSMDHFSLAGLLGLIVGALSLFIGYRFYRKPID